MAAKYCTQITIIYCNKKYSQKEATGNTICTYFSSHNRTPNQDVLTYNISGRLALQKRIMAVLRSVKIQTSGNKQVKLLYMYV